MPDGSLHHSSDEVSDFTITVACDCYCDTELVRGALDEQSDFNGAVAWGAPRTPDRDTFTTGAELVLIVSDTDSVTRAIDRSSNYREFGQPHILIHLHDEEDVPAEGIPGLALARSRFASGLASMNRALFEPIIPQGLVCVDWADTRHVLDMAGGMVIEESSGNEREQVVESAVSRLRARASARPIHGLQVSLLSSPKNLAVRHVHQLLTSFKEVAGDAATIIVASPFLDWPGSDYWEVRFVARIGNAAPSPPDDPRVALR